MGVILVTVWSILVFVHSSAGLQCYSCEYVNITDHSEVPVGLAFPNSSDACQPGKTPTRDFIKPCESADSNKIFTCLTITEVYLPYAIMHSRSCIQVSNDSTWLNQCGNYSRGELEAESDLEQILFNHDDLKEARICSCTENCTSVNETVQAVNITQTTMKTTTLLSTSTFTTPFNTNTNQRNSCTKPVVTLLLLLFSAIFTAVMRVHRVECY